MLGGAIGTLAGIPRAGLRLLDDVNLIARSTGDFRGHAEQLTERADALLARADEAIAEMRAGTRTAARLLEQGEGIVEIGVLNRNVGKQLVEHLDRLDVHMRNFDRHLVRLGELAERLDEDLPAFVEATETMAALSQSAEVLSEAAPPVQAAAERVEQIASKVPGLRRTGNDASG